MFSVLRLQPASGEGAEQMLCTSRRVPAISAEGTSRFLIAKCLGSLKPCWFPNHLSGCSDQSLKDSIAAEWCFPFSQCFCSCSVMIIMGHCLLSQLHSNVVFHSPPLDCFHSILSFLFGFELFLIQDREKAPSNQKMQHPWPKYWAWVVVRS